VADSKIFVICSDIFLTLHFSFTFKCELIKLIIIIIIITKVFWAHLKKLNALTLL